LVDDKPRYAKRKNTLSKLAKEKDIDKIIKCVATAFPNCKGFKKFAEELNDLKNEGVELSNEDASGLLDYYKQIYPEDYAIDLVYISIDPANKDNYKEKLDMYSKDFDISDESLDQMEKSLSGNQDPAYRKDYGFGDFNYDYLSDSRSDTTLPQDYELRLSKKKQS
jgi:hypothetical protein